VCLPSGLGAGAWQEPSWFLHIPWCGRAMCRQGVWRCWSFASSWWFSCLCVSSISGKFLH
jgi:hypothetical protein